MRSGNDILELLGIAASDVEEMERTYTGGSLYKYLPVERASDFFKAPKIRFTQKDALNDPFELSKRWDELASGRTKKGIADYLEHELRAKLKDDVFLFEFAKTACEKGIGRPLEAGEIEQLRGYVFSSAFDERRRIVEAQLGGEIALMIEGVFSDDSSSRLLAHLVAKTGIFSVSETHSNEQLWGLYASSGKGFVVEFDVRHPFFEVPSKGTPAFRKVRYTDERIPAFMTNPYYFFLVKNEKWAFEREWRMTKNLTECDETVSVGGDEIHLCGVRPGMIKSVVFGYRYGEEALRASRDLMSAFDANVEFKRAIVDSDSGFIRVENS